MSRKPPEAPTPPVTPKAPEPVANLPEAARLVGDYPHIPVVLNHTGFPWDRSPEGLARWRAEPRRRSASSSRATPASART